MSRAIDVMAEAFVAHALHQVEIPPRIQIEYTPSDAGQHTDGTTDGTIESNTALIMPACQPDRGNLSVKVISLCPRNSEKGLAMIQAIVLLVDSDNGRPLAMLDGGSLTAIRTGAASGLATRLLARADVKNAFIFGAGVQARTQLEGVIAARPSIERAWVTCPDMNLSERFAEEMSQRCGITVTPTDNLSELPEADVVCTATPSREPLFQASQIKQGCHINAIGSYKITMRELPPALLPEALIVVDDIEHCLSETGDLILPIRDGIIGRENIFAELGELAQGTKTVEPNGTRISLFKSVGLGVQDLYAAKAAFDEAARKNIGTEIDF